MVFIGSASVKGGETYTYKLSLNDSAGVLSGYSVTDVMGPNETRTAIKGKMDAAGKQLSFRETYLISTKSTVPKNEFCFLNAHLKLSKKQGATFLKGSFTGYKDDRKTECASGKMSLFCAQDILAKLEKMAGNRDTTKDPVLTPEKVEEKKNVYLYEKSEAIDPAKVLTVKPGKVLEINCPAAEITLNIWDDKTIDGDIITIMHNDNLLLSEHKLTGVYKEVKINMHDRKTDKLKIIAISEGSEPVNTARIKLTSGNLVRYIDASSTLANPVTIVLTRD